MSGSGLGTKTVPQYKLRLNKFGSQPSRPGSKLRLLPESKLKLKAPTPPRDQLKADLQRVGQSALYELIAKYPMSLTPPPGLPPLLPELRRQTKPSRSLQRIFFGPIPDEVVILETLGQALAVVGKGAKKAGDYLTSGRPKLWVIYENDGAPPLNPGGGSDQGPTAALTFAVTYEGRKTGLTRLGWTVIDMRTPKPTLPAGAPQNSSSQYTTPAGPYSGINSLDFEVTWINKDTIKVSFPISVGVDSARWGQTVQDFIHKHVSDSPTLPWTKRGPKVFAQGGVAALWKPSTVILEQDVFGITFKGKIELSGKLETGTHRTEGTVGARLVIRSAEVKTRLGLLTVEYTALGAYGRAFMRYNDGRESGKIGVEGVLTKRLMVNIGRVGIGLQGTITVSTDPALRTDLPAGAAPVLSPLAPVPGGPSVGGPAGAHSSGMLIFTWQFGKD